MAGGDQSWTSAWSTGGGNSGAIGSPGAGVPSFFPNSGGGGHSLLGGLVHGGITHDVTHAAHWTLAKAALAGHDLAAIPAGLVTTGEGIGKDIGAAAHGNFSFAHTRQDVIAFGKSSLASLEHPLRDPFQTILTLSMVLNGGASLALRAGAAADAAKALEAAGYGEKLKAAVESSAKKPGLARPGLRVGIKQTDLLQPNSAMHQVGAYAHDKIVQKAMNAERAASTVNKSGEVTDTLTGLKGKAIRKVAGYGNTRVRGAINDAIRPADRAAQTKVNRFAADLKGNQTSPVSIAAADAAKNLVMKRMATLPPDAHTGQVLKAVSKRVPIDRLREQDHGFLDAGNRPGYFDEKGITDHPQVDEYWNTYKRELDRHIAAVKETGKPAEDFKPITDTKQTIAKVSDLNAAVQRNQLRRTVVATGSKVRRTARDTLVKIPEKIDGNQVDQVINGVKADKGTWGEADQQAVGAMIDDLTNGAGGKTTGLTRATANSAKAPKGMMWVDEKLAKDLVTQYSPTRYAKIGKWADNMNAATTALTVYYKLGHAPTRVGTNLAATLVQGSLHDVPRSFSIWKGLSREDRDAVLAHAGKTSFQALPQEGMSVAARSARWGAQNYGKFIDAPFRFNSFIHEAAAHGYKSAADIHRLVTDPKLRGDMNQISAKADREAIAYDRMNDVEKNVLTRAIWFYPWVQGSSRFFGNTVLEHPTKAALAGEQGEVGRKRQDKAFGELASYNEGLVPLSGGANPLTTNLSTFSPYATLGDLLSMPEHGRPAEMLNPADSLVNVLLNRSTSYGQPTTNPIGEALRGAIAPTPEGQTLLAYLDRNKMGNRAFHTTPLDAVLRGIAGPSMVRRYYTAAGQQGAERERTGR